MNVVFRADASLQIGTGHVMRCLTLAEALKAQGHNCQFICRARPGHLGDVIEARGFNVDLLEPSRMPLDAEGQATAHANWLGASWLEDAEQTRQCLEGTWVDWLVVDHYALDASWEGVITPCVRHILAIDDIADRHHNCDVLLDQNLGRRAEDYDGLVSSTVERLIGPNYALLRPEFLGWRAKSLDRRKYPELKRILISLGGVDQMNVTGRVLAALSQTSLSPDTKLDIVLGAAAPWLSEVQAQADELPFDAHVSLNVSDMAERMALADLSIGAAGSTSWERCCLGLPAIIIVLADNQRMLAEALVDASAAVALRKEVVGDRLGALIEDLSEYRGRLCVLSEHAASICDGNGVRRVVAALIERSVKDSKGRE